MHIEDFIMLANRYKNLGDSIQDQMEDLLTYGAAAKLNPNAVRYIANFAKVVDCYDIDDSELLSESVNSWIESRAKENAD